MSTNTSFAPIAFPDLAAEPAPLAAALQNRVGRRTAPVDFEPDDTRTRPVSVRMTPLAFPELVRDDSNETLERARVQGHAAGYAAGRRAATETLAADRAALRVEHERALGEEITDLRDALDAVRQMAGALNAQTVEAFEATEESVLAAAVEIAAAILGRTIADDPDGSALAAVARALEAAGPVPVRVVRLHPADLAVVEAVTEPEAGLRLVADPRLQRGDAMVDLPDGVIDACVGSAVDRVRRALTGGDS